ncbi:MAG: hypothetical protein GY751_02940 [Bacteroidetes bacterium]|nr:hypothetical protein [Bacteroidota bacterium]
MSASIAVMILIDGGVARRVPFAALLTFFRERLPFPAIESDNSTDSPITGIP